MHKLQVMIICCPWIDHQSYCSIPTELELWAVPHCEMLELQHSSSLLTRVFSPFSGQFLTWSFFAPISCLALNGFHSCFLKPVPGQLSGWSQPVIDHPTRSRVWESLESLETLKTASGSFILQWINTGGKVKKKFHELHKGCWFINDNFTILCCVLL